MLNGSVPVIILTGLMKITFGAHCKTCLLMLKSHLTDHVVEDVAKRFRAKYLECSAIWIIFCAYQKCISKFISKTAKRDGKNGQSARKHWMVPKIVRRSEKKG